MNTKRLYKLKSKFVVRTVGTELILVPLTDNIIQMNELFVLNETAKLIWENLDENITVTEIENRVMQTYRVDYETVKEDIEVFIQKLEILL